jgi:hypothetical protein
MNRRPCFNCQTAWPSLADHELDARHSCPECGDELGPLSDTQFELISAPVHRPLPSSGKLAA